jgi:hypothetical protein
VDDVPAARFDVAGTRRAVTIPSSAAFNAQLATQSPFAQAGWQTASSTRPSHAAPMPGSAPSPHAPAGSSGSAGGGLSGGASSALFALLVALAALAVGSSSRLRIAPVRWRPLAFVAVIERPG